MDGVSYTKHFEHRFQLRGITTVVVEALLNYGVGRKSGHRAESLTFSKEALAEIRSDLPLSVFRACEKLRNTYIIISDDGVLITVARSYKKAVH